MTETPPISVLLPTRGESPWFAAALRSAIAQTLRPAEVLVVHTDAGDPPDLLPDPVVRLIRAPGANLARALNLGLREARCPLVARMDDDDESLPGRLAAQAGAMESRPELVALGTGFERIDRAGGLIESCTPPTDRREVRWRLLLGNCVTHGSVMLRREAVLAEGGYDESCERAQDFELWLRLTRDRPCVANLAEILYRYRCDPADRVGAGWRSSPGQEAVAARALKAAWERLPSVSPDIELERANALASRGAGTAPIEALLTQRGPTIERVRALEAARASGLGVPASREPVRLARLREVGSLIRSSGVRRLWLWGAGRHTRWVLENKGSLGLDIAGVVDDARAGDLFEHAPVANPSSLGTGDHVLLSSDAHEDAMWTSSASARARGVTVWRLYGGSLHASAAGAAA